MPGKKSKDKHSLLIPKHHTSFNNPFKEVIKDDGNVEKQKKVRRNYTSEMKSTINNDNSENEYFHDNYNNSDSISVSNDNNEEYYYDHVTETHYIDECKRTVETSRGSDVNLLKTTKYRYGSNYIFLIFMVCVGSKRDDTKTEKKYSQNDQCENEDEDKQTSMSSRFPALYTDKKCHNFLDSWSEEGFS